jgi:integrase
LPDSNPVAGISWYLDKPRKRDTYIADSDLPKFWTCLNVAPAKINSTMVVLIKVILLTGLRINSARQLKWQMVNLDDRAIRIPAELMKGRRPLELSICNGLYDILRAWRERGISSDGYVFASALRGKFLTEIRPALAYIAEQAGISVTAHDLRRTFARAGKRAGLNRWQVAAMLAHSQSSLTDDYAGTSDADDLREPMQRVTDHLLKLCGGNVIAFDPKRAA